MDIQTLHDRIYNDNETKNSKVFIKVYEENKELIEGREMDIANPNFQMLLRIIADYAISLSSYGSSQKAILYLNRAISFYDNAGLTNKNLYEDLIFTRGIEFYNQKKFAEAKIDFKYLVTHYPEIDKYKRWLFAVKMITFRKITYAGLFSGFALLISTHFLRRTEHDLRGKLLMLALILFLSSSALEFIVFFLKKNSSNN